MVFKCKMCDASLNINVGDSIAVCEYCGTTQTVPRINDEKIANLYQRAEHYRKNNEFDKAMALYEEILNENPTDAESYWSIILCKYGIEYVEDFNTGKRIPTVNRTQVTSVFDDENYKAALRYADEEQKKIYQEEAKVINEIQKEILAISQKEEPFDIFICYKETDEQGRRTLDSVLAMDLYEKLGKEGYKVFYARVTLDDKFGVAYEPYIFAALQSAKVMIVVGTKPENFEAAWVRNEWSRYLGLIKNGAEKTLIPAYKDMDPYEMPDEFAHLQALDMGELGFHQDLILGIRKIISNTSGGVSNSSVGNLATNVKGLLERGYLFIEDGEWSRADECMEMALNNEPRNAEAYLGKLLVALKINWKEDLKKSEVIFEDDENYLKILRFGDEEIKQFVNNALEEVRVRESAEIYEETKKKLENTISPQIIKECKDIFEKLGDFRDSATLAEQCDEKIIEVQERQKQDTYKFYCEVMESDDKEKWEVALKYFESVPGYLDANEKARLCKWKLASLVNAEIESAENATRQSQGVLYNKDPQKLAITIALISLAIGALSAIVMIILENL